MNDKLFACFFSYLRDFASRSWIKFSSAGLKQTSTVSRRFLRKKNCFSFSIPKVHSLQNFAEPIKRYRDSEKKKGKHIWPWIFDSFLKFLPLDNGGTCYAEWFIWFRLKTSTLLRYTSQKLPVSNGSWMLQRRTHDKLNGISVNISLLPQMGWRSTHTPQQFTSTIVFFKCLPWFVTSFSDVISFQYFIFYLKKFYFLIFD